MQITPIMIGGIRWKFALNFCHDIMVHLFYPETSGHSLEDMDSMFPEGSNRVLVVKKKCHVSDGFKRRYDGRDESAVIT